jgi:hypothetical protein
LTAFDIDAARVKHGQVLVLETGGRTAVFRRMSIEEARELAATVMQVPELAFELGHSAARACLLSDAADFEVIAAETPLAFDYDGGLLDKLLAIASAESAAAAKDAVRRWKSAERDLGKAAENLLAWKAYAGGTPSPAAFAGALHVAEGIDSVKSLLRLHIGFMKAMSKR